MARGAPGPRLSSWLVLAMLGMVALPAALTLRTVQIPAAHIPGGNPTPHGYTWSLLLFIVPIVAIAGWFLPSEGIEVPRRAFWRTIGVLVPLGFALDFFFANRFFSYPNSGATLGIGAPALGGPVPVEEYGFYLTGFLAVLLLYVWLGEYWLAAYSAPDSIRADDRVLRRLLQFHPASVVAGLLLIASAVVYKKVFSPVPAGFPGYFTFIVCGALIPSALLFPAARPRINWRALSATMFIVVLISLLWEATLAVPYGWWEFQPRSMMGVFITAWTGLPLEEVIVWIAVTYATVIVYEVMKAWQASGQSFRAAFLHPAQTAEGERPVMSR